MDDTTRIGRPQPGGAHKVPALSRLTIKTSPDERQVGQSFEMRGADTIIGRRDGCTIVLHDPNVSREHAVIHRQDNADWITDGGSSNGTLLNGHPVTNPTRLSKGDVLLLGSTALLYEQLA